MNLSFSRTQRMECALYSFFIFCYGMSKLRAMFLLCLAQNWLAVMFRIFYLLLWKGFTQKECFISCLGSSQWRSPVLKGKHMVSMEKRPWTLPFSFVSHYGCISSQEVCQNICVVRGWRMVRRVRASHNFSFINFGAAPMCQRSNGYMWGFVAAGDSAILRGP